MKALLERGVSVWLDSLGRDMLHSGFLKGLIDDGLRGQTSNPTIFQGAVSKSSTYSDEIRGGAEAGKTAEQICWDIMIADVQAACDAFLPTYRASNGLDGYVSLELDPTKANDTEGSILQGRELWPRVNRPNLMIKVPATKAGLPVVRALLADGCNVNVTLLFAVERYDEVMDIHMQALEDRVAKGLAIDKVASVASFFVSRVDTEAEKRFAKLGDPSAAKGLLGKVAVANARAAYAKFQQRISSERWKALIAKGAQVQRPLWASTGTKNPAYKDTIYVDTLVGPHCVNTLPEGTLRAIQDHGSAEPSLRPADLDDAAKVLKEMANVGVDLADITLNTLEVEGVQKFIDSYLDLLKTVENAMKSLRVG